MKGPVRHDEDGGWWMLCRRVMQLLPLPLWHQADTLQPPRADLVAEGWHSNSTFSVLRSLYPFSLPHSQWDSWIYSAISSLALCCAEQSVLQQTGLLYRDLHQLQTRDRQATHSGRICGGGQILLTPRHKKDRHGSTEGRFSNVCNYTRTVQFVFKPSPHYITDLVKLCIFPSLKRSGQGFLL